MFNYFKFNINYPRRLIFQTSDGAYPKDPKAAALVSGDIDQVFAAFGLEPGFLNRKQFLVKHPELIEYINAKIGETRIQPTAEGYRGTSSENGAYIEFFKEHAGDIENMVHNPASHNATQAQTEAGITPSQPIIEMIPPAPSQETSANPILPVQEIQSANMNQETPPSTEPQASPTIQIGSEAQLEEINQEAPKETHELSHDSDKLPMTHEEEKPSYVFSSPAPESTEHPIETETKQSMSADAEDLIAPYQEDISNKTESNPEDTNTASLEDDMNEPHSPENIQLSSLYDLEDLDWWPHEYFKLQIKDAKNGIMEVIDGGGLKKRSILYAITVLENGNIWLFTDDPTVPQEDRDLVIDFEEFKALIESSS